jgi:hypothetical protein
MYIHSILLAFPFTGCYSINIMGASHRHLFRSTYILLLPILIYRHSRDRCLWRRVNFPYCDVHYNFRIKTMSGSSLPPVVCRRDRVLFSLLVFVCTLWCPTHIVLCFSFVCLRLVYPMLPFSLDLDHPFFLLFLRYSLAFIIYIQIT